MAALAQGLKAPSRDWLAFAVLVIVGAIIDVLVRFVPADLPGFMPWEFSWPVFLATALTLVPLLWLTVFGRHHQIAYRGDWPRAIRRAAWVGIVVAVLIVLRLQGLLELPIALFMIALVVVAEATLSVER